jgi:hypothetical protein
VSILELNVKNLSKTLLTQDIGLTETSFKVADAGALPNPPFLITVEGEIMRVGSKNVSTNTLSNVLRGREGTSPAPHSSGTVVENRFTAGTYDEIKQTVTSYNDALTSHLADNTAHGVDTKIPKSLATAANQFLVSSGASNWVIKTIAQVKELLGLKSAAYTESSSYATAAQGIKADNALPKSGGTMTGILTAASNTSYTVRQVRNIILSNADADVGAMQNGDIWIKYK